MGLDRPHRIHCSQRQSGSTGCGLQKRPARVGSDGWNSRCIVTQHPCWISRHHDRCVDPLCHLSWSVVTPTELCVVGAFRHAGARAASGVQRFVNSADALAASGRDRHRSGHRGCLGMVCTARALHRRASKTNRRCAGGSFRSPGPRDFGAQARPPRRGRRGG